MTSIVVTIDTDGRAAAPGWIAQILANHLADKAYVDAITMSVNGAPAVPPRQIWLGMTDVEFAEHEQATAARYAAVMEWNAFTVRQHQREAELVAGGMSKAKARDTVRVENVAEHDRIWAAAGWS